MPLGVACSQATMLAEPVFFGLRGKVSGGDIGDKRESTLAGGEEPCPRRCDADGALGKKRFIKEDASKLIKKAKN